MRIDRCNHKISLSLSFTLRATLFLIHHKPAIANPSTLKMSPSMSSYNVLSFIPAEVCLTSWAERGLFGDPAAFSRAGQ